MASTARRQVPAGDEARHRQRKLAGRGRPAPRRPRARHRLPLPRSSPPTASGVTRGPDPLADAPSEPTAVFSLPDDRGWEMVSPIDKNGGEIQGFDGIFGGGVLQAAAQGGAVTYSSTSSFGAPPGLAGRQPVRLDAGAARAGRRRTSPCRCSPAAIPNRRRAASPTSSSPTDLAGGLVSNGRRCRSSAPEALPGGKPAAGRAPARPPATATTTCATTPTAPTTALLTSADIGGLALGPEDFELAFAGATPDLAHVVLSTCAALTADATEVAGQRRRMRPGQAEPLREVRLRAAR